MLFSCGGDLQNSESVSDKVDANYERGALVFDPFSTDASSPIGVPFPNDIFLSSETKGSEEESYLYFDPDKAKDEATKVLYEALNQLKLKGFSPNMPIFVPLASDYSIDLKTLEGRFVLVDLTAIALNDTASINQTNCLTFKQDGKYLKFYPLRPLKPGHQYLFVLLKGIKDVSGRELLPPSVFLELESEKPLDNSELEALREKYKPLFDKVLPGLGLNKKDVLEIFTFTTADKTLSVSDFGIIDAYLKGEIGDLNIQGLPYANVTEDYGSIDSLVDKVYYLAVGNAVISPIIKQIAASGKFPAFDISKLKEFFGKLLAVANGTLPASELDINDYIKVIPVYFGNRNSFSGAVYIFQHGLGSSRTRAEKLIGDINLPVVAIDLPYHGDYTKLYENDDFVCGEGKCFLTGNPVKNRMNVYQAVFNLRLLEKLLRGGFYDVNGDGTPDNVTDVNFLGISMGAIVGSIYAKYGTPSKVVLNVGGANYVSIVDAATNQLIEGLLEAAGVEKNTYAYAYMLGITQLIQDPADPVYVGIDNGTNVILQNAYGDTVVPNVSNAILAARVGFGNYTTVLDAKPPAALGWYMFGNETYWGVHGFLLGVEDAVSKYPEAAEHINQDVVDKLGKFARQQVNDFFTLP